MKRPLTVGILPALGLVLVVRGVVYLQKNGGDSRGDRPPVAAAGLGGVDAGGDAAEEAEPDAADALEPPTPDEIAALESGDTDALTATLRSLRARAVTPAGLAALDLAERRTTDPDLLRQMACYRAREAASLDAAFSTLPQSAATDVEWLEDGAACLVELIATRADELPERALPLLVERVLIQDNGTILGGLAKLDPPQLPAPIAAEIATGAPTRSRRAALKAAVALGAAAKWPEQVEAWLGDSNRHIRLLVHEALGNREDDASQTLAARAIANQPQDDEMTRRAAELIGRDTGFDRRLVAVAADTNESAEARANAAGIVAIHGGELACRQLVTITTTDAELAPQLEVALRRADQRFQGRLRRAE